MKRTKTVPRQRVENENEELAYLRQVVEFFLPADTMETLSMAHAIMDHPDGIEGFLKQNGRISLPGYAQCVTELLHRALHAYDHTHEASTKPRLFREGILDDD